MTILKYKETCEEIKLDADVKQDILTEILAKPKFTVSEESKITEEEHEEDQMEAESVRKRGLRGKKRLVLVAAACLLIGSVTVVAVEKSRQSRPHLQNKVYMNENEEDIIFTDTVPQDWIYEAQELLGETDEETSPIEQTSLEYATLEDALYELHISPLLPENTQNGWTVNAFEISETDWRELPECGMSYKDYFLDIQYVNDTSAEQTVRFDIGISHVIYLDGSSGQTATFFEKEEGMENLRTYVSESGREFVLYEMKNPEDGMLCTYVHYVYADRYWSDEWFRETAVDNYVSHMECRGMSEEEICAMLDVLVPVEYAD